MIRSPRRLSLAVLAASLAGCASTPRIAPPPPSGDASWRMVAPPGTVRYQLGIGEVSSGATPFRRVKPVYPPGLLAICPPPQEVPALLILDDQGAVAEVRVSAEQQADASRHAFIDAVRAAARQWPVQPLSISRRAAEADGK
jgi:hypothetical protein